MYRNYQWMREGHQLYSAATPPPARSTPCSPLGVVSSVAHHLRVVSEDGNDYMSSLQNATHLYVCLQFLHLNFLFLRIPEYIWNWSRCFDILYCQLVNQKETVQEWEWTFTMSPTYCINTQMHKCIMLAISDRFTVGLGI